MKIIEGYRNGDDMAVAMAKAKLERQYRFENVVKNHVLYSHTKGDVVNYPEWVRQKNEEYEDMIFDLAENSNESIRTIRDFTVEEMVRFNKRVYEKLLRKSRKHGGTE